MSVEEQEAVAGELFKGLTQQQKDSAMKHFSFVGYVASFWAAFEMLIDSMAAQLAKIPEDFGYCFTAQVIGPARKLDAYFAVARLRGVVKLGSEFDAFAKATARLGERRNRIIHDPWSVLNGQEPTRFEITAKSKLRKELVPMSEEEINKFLTDIIAHLNAFMILHEKVVAEVGT